MLSSLLVKWWNSLSRSGIKFKGVCPAECNCESVGYEVKEGAI